jgi:hypothetical protein
VTRREGPTTNAPFSKEEIALIRQAIVTPGATVLQDNDLRKFPLYEALYARRRDPVLLALIGVAAARSGDPARAREVIRQLRELPRRGNRPTSWNQAYVAGALEECALVVERLRDALQIGMLHPRIHGRLGFRYCRHDPEFQRIASPRGWPLAPPRSSRPAPELVTNRA